jgi:ketosteroid isomerase-like protein
MVLESPEEAESQFYDAMQRGDVESMMALWADDDEVVCVHPGGARVIGTAAVRAAFAAIFANGGVPVRPERVHRLQHSGAAVHHLAERVEVVTASGLQTAWIFATNVYISTPQGWRMVAHHASPGTAEDAAVAPPPPSTLH